MTICPVCNAQLEDLRECHRCKTDLGQIIDTKKESIYHLQKAVTAFQQSRFHDMFFHARRSFTLFSSPESVRLFACAAILVNKPDLGYVMWKRLKSCE